MIDRTVYCDRTRQRATVKDTIVWYDIMSQSLSNILITLNSKFSSQKAQKEYIRAVTGVVLAEAEEEIKAQRAIQITFTFWTGTDRITEHTPYINKNGQVMRENTGF